ncbi:MAG: hypothetical protein RLZZ200_2605 [Pseudomonadota bacterium]|jgi:diacylglycerol kinase (ATP)
MKNQPFHRRLGHALGGIAAAWANERSFRVQVLALAALGVALCILRPGAVWTALLLLAATAVIAAELVNTAIEALADRLHPEQHPQIRIVKDCAAAAVLAAALGAVGAATALAIHLWR